MTLPQLLGQATAVLGPDTAIAAGLVGTIVLAAMVVGEARWQVSHLREWKREAEAELKALRVHVSALEVREGRTLERIDHLTDQLARIEAKVDKLLERDHHKSA